MRFWRKREPKHVHEWACVGYGGTGWYLWRCSACGEETIEPHG